ncbi:MAG: hypothetical protein V1804_02370, partial [Patescibacteria group bacterium]
MPELNGNKVELELSKKLGGLLDAEPQVEKTWESLKNMQKRLKDVEKIIKRLPDGTNLDFLKTYEDQRGELEKQISEFKRSPLTERKINKEKLVEFLENEDFKEKKTEYRSPDGKYFIAIQGYDKEEKEVEIIEGETKKGGKRGHRSIHISTLIRKLGKCKPVDKVDETYLEEEEEKERIVSEESKEKEQTTPEKIRLKLDELKKYYIEKESELKKAKTEGKSKEEIEALEKEIKEMEEEINENLKYFDASRKASEKILGKLRNQTRDADGNLVHGYEDINAKTKEEGNEKFLKKAKQLWLDFVTHGTIVWDNNSKEYKFNKEGNDLDSETCEEMLKRAGLSLKYLERVAQGEFVKGKTMIDTGNESGVVLKPDGSLFIDHHSEDSPRDTSSAEETYNLLVSMGSLEEDKTLGKLIKFINEVDNAVDVNVDSYYINSWKTVRGLHRHMHFGELYGFLKNNRDPNPDRILSDKEIKNYHLAERSKKQEERAKEIHEVLEGYQKDGFIIDSEKYGKIVIDIGGKARKDFEAIRAFGANTYLIWNLERGEFWLTSENPINDEFSQGRKVRNTMWITQKKVGKPEPMKMTLEEVLKIMTDGKLEPSEKLVSFFEEEIKERKTRKIAEGEIKKEPESWRLETHLKNAEKDFQEAKEEYQVSRQSNRMRAWGVSPYEDLFPGDDYSIRKKTARQNFEEAKNELERLRKIALNKEEIERFEKEEKEKAEKKNRLSEMETQAEKSREELDVARKEYVEMMKNKKGMWNSVNKFFGRIIKKEEPVKVGMEGIDKEGNYFNKN